MTTCRPAFSFLVASGCPAVSRTTEVFCFLQRTKYGRNAATAQWNLILTQTSYDPKMQIAFKWDAVCLLIRKCSASRNVQMQFLHTSAFQFVAYRHSGTIMIAGSADFVCSGWSLINRSHALAEMEKTASGLSALFVIHQ